MILVKSLIFLLLLIIIAHLIKLGWGNREGFTQHEIYPTAPDENIANELESQSSEELLGAATGTVGLTAAQKAQHVAHLEKNDEENNTIKNHQYISQNSNEMLVYKNQIDELLKLSNEAKSINESFTNKD